MTYLYNVILFRNPETIGIPPNSYAADIADFETNYKSQAMEVNAVVLAETTFEVAKSYANFKVLIDGVLRTWSDVKYTEDTVKYSLNLLTENAI